MNCPKCGKEMEAGILFGNAPLLWTPKKRPLLIPKDCDESIINGEFPEAFICKFCRKVIVDY